MPDRYPPLEPYAAGRLDVGDGHRLWWETAGSRHGRPALVLHGGPGSGCAPGMRQLFDPSAYRIVLVDQRGAGRSTPSAVDPATDMSLVRTDRMVADLERLREHLGIDRWLLLGISWGSTLALAYAQQHSDRVTALVLGPVTVTRRSDVSWLTRGVGRFFPEEWERFRAGVPPQDRDGDLAAAYSGLLESPDAAVRERAAQDWCDWEEVVVSAESSGTSRVPDSRYEDPDFRYRFARTVTHVFGHGAWLEEGQLVRDAGRLAGVPGVLVHGRLDLGGPLGAAWELWRAWPGSELVVVEGGGHTSLGDALVDATDRLARR